MTQPLTPKYLDSVIRKPEKIRVSETHPVSMYGVKKASGNSIPLKMKYTFPGTSQKVLALGSYPSSRLGRLETRLLWAKNLIADGKDPTEAETD